MNYKNQIEKIAASKVESLYRAGKLGAKDAAKAFKPGTVADNIHNRINARMARQAGGVMPKNMTAKGYKNVSKVDSLTNKPAIDTNRLLKHQGHENSKIVSELNRQTGGRVSINNSTTGVLDGGSNVGWNINESKPSRWNIEMPQKHLRELPKSYNMRPLSDRSARELRGYVANHEIAGEATSQARMLKYRRGIGWSTPNSEMNVFRINGHNNPDVLGRDAEFVRRLSPESQKTFTRKLQNNVTGIRNSSFKNGQNFTESDLFNATKNPTNTVNSSQQRAIATPIHKAKLPTKQEQLNQMRNIAELNLGTPNYEVVDEIARGYQNTPFF